MMKYIIKLFSEIIVKSRSVRLFFIKSLTKNIQILLKNNGFLIFSIIRYWDRIELYIADIKHNHNMIEVIQLLIKVPGICQVLLVKEFFFNNFQDIYEHVIFFYYEKLLGKSFCVRVRRKGKHHFKSKDVECYLGNRIRQNVKNTYVKLINPEVLILLEIIGNRFFLVFDRYQGLGGFPLGTQENVLSLISGGYDSAVSSYVLMRKGCKLHYCFFHFGEASYELSVKKIAYYLWKKFGSSHRVYFFSINCMPVINEITSKVSMKKNIIVIFKRMIFRIASCIAIRYNIQSLATGESIGQVSSQTLTNLRIIDSVSDVIILRPLIAYHKEEIISLSRNIGIEDMVKSIDFEYCSMFFKHATAQAVQHEIEQDETKIDFSIINKILMKIQVLNIHDVLMINKVKNINNVEITSYVKDGEIVLDIRTPEEQANCPLCLDEVVVVKKLPFYKLVNQFTNLDSNKFYLLYCKSGKMSILQASYLREQGFKNFKIFRPLLF